MKDQLHKVTATTQALSGKSLETLENVLAKTTTEVDRYIAPVRTSVISRYPVLFSLLVTMGVAATFLGFEKLVSSVPILDENPVLLLIVGISILAATGTLYKKLS
jgi:hypothetical protein